MGVTAALKKFLSGVNEAIEDYTKESPDNKNKDEQKPATEQAGAEEENTSYEVNSVNKYNAAKTQQNETEPQEIIYIAGKAVRGPWTHEILSIRASLSKQFADEYNNENNANATSETADRDVEEQNELALKWQGKVKDKDDKEKNPAIDHELENEKDPIKRKEILKARSKTLKFVEQLEEVAIERVMAQIQWVQFVMQQQLEHELKAIKEGTPGHFQNMVSKQRAGVALGG